MGQKFNWQLWVWSMGIWIIIFLISLKLGATDDLSFELITTLRLPRVLLAQFVGMGLAISGLVLQALFSNPLCEPYTLGVSSGAALGTVIGLSLGLEWNWAGLAGTSLVGALFFMGILLALAKRTSINTEKMLLMGVMLGFVGTSLLTLWISLSQSAQLQNTMAWIFGDLSKARLKGVCITGGLILVVCCFIWRKARDLDGFLLGDTIASSLGIDVSQVRWNLILYTSLLISLCVSSAGIIGFVGLIIPHLMRQWMGSLHRPLIPLVAIWGGSLLMFSDLLSRIIMRPYELPVGVVTALIGAPFFLWLMLKRNLT